MKETMESYFIHLKEKYGAQKVVLQPPYTGDLTQIPEVLHPFYRFAGGAELPFGIIYTPKAALRQEKGGIPKEWFCFGEDFYFSFYLCLFHPDEEGLSLTSWDHEASEIDGAIAKDLIELLHDLEEEFDAFEQEDFE